jgi:hypothetical protein
MKQQIVPPVGFVPPDGFGLLEATVEDRDVGRIVATKWSTPVGEKHAATSVSRGGALDLRFWNDMVGFVVVYSRSK